MISAYDVRCLLRHNKKTIEKIETTAVISENWLRQLRHKSPVFLHRSRWTTKGGSRKITNRSFSWESSRHQSQVQSGPGQVTFKPRHRTVSVAFVSPHPKVERGRSVGTPDVTVPGRHVIIAGALLHSFVVYIHGTIREKTGES